MQCSIIWKSVPKYNFVRRNLVMWPCISKSKSKVTTGSQIELSIPRTTPQQCYQYAYSVHFCVKWSRGADRYLGPKYIPRVIPSCVSTIMFILWSHKECRWQVLTAWKEEEQPNHVCPMNVAREIGWLIWLGIERIRRLPSFDVPLLSLSIFYLFVEKCRLLRSWIGPRLYTVQYTVNVLTTIESQLLTGAPQNVESRGEIWKWVRDIDMDIERDRERKREREKKRETETERERERLTPCITTPTLFGEANDRGMSAIWMPSLFAPTFYMFVRSVRHDLRQTDACSPARHDRKTMQVRRTIYALNYFTEFYICSRSCWDREIETVGTINPAIRDDALNNST